MRWISTITNDRNGITVGEYRWFCSLGNVVVEGVYHMTSGNGWIKNWIKKWRELIPILPIHWRRNAIS
jgi:hypothetical protein